jgi:ribosomal protein L7Ae-like RNA K-turn-binding protein
MTKRATSQGSGKTSPDPVLQLLGLAARAGALVPGTQLVREAVRAGRVHFALVASDLTATGRDKLVPMLESREVAYGVVYSRAELGRAVGRGPLAGLGVTDEGFARRFRVLLETAGDSS